MIELALVVAVVSWAARVAVQRGRNGVGWGALALLAGAAGYFATSLCLARAVTRDLENLLVVVLYVALPLVVGGGSMLLVLRVIYSLPPRLRRGTSWPVYRIGIGGHAGADGTLAIAADGLRFEPIGGEAIVIPYPALEQAVEDGEAVRIEWRGAESRAEELLLTPTGKADSREWRIAQSALMARRISARRASG